MIRRILYGCLVLFMGNLGAMTDLVLHPDIPYFDDEHVVAGGLTAVVTILLLGALERYLTRRKHMEGVLRTSEEQLLVAQKIARLGYYALDVASGMWTSSTILDDIFGIGDDYRRDVEGWSLIVHPEDRQRMIDYMDDVIGKKRPFDCEYRIVRPADHAVRWVHGLGSLEFDAANRPVRMVGTVQDITVGKQADEEKARLEAQFLQAHRMESVGRLAGGIAHDFNNMLGAILGYTELALAKAGPGDPLHDDLLEIHKAARRSADLTRQLLAFARRQIVAPRVLDLNETVAGMLNMLKRLIGENIHLAWRPDPGLWPVKVDPSQIDQILANLCVNARDAIADIGTITIETGNSTFDEDGCAAYPGLVPGEYVRLAVSDTGCGMDAETLAHVFEPFFTTKGVGKGTGLGLATVYGSVKQNDGFIAVDSEQGRGTMFTIYLPRYVGNTGQKQTEGAAGPAKRGHETILLVEDEPAILKLAKLVLEQQGYTVLAARTPGEAIRLGQEHAGQIHLLITDVVMPEMNGLDLARKLLALCPHLERLFMSGYTSDVIAHHGVLEDGMAFIQKPFPARDLTSTVRSLLDRRSRTGPVG